MDENHRFFLQQEYVFGYMALSVSSDEEKIVGDALIEATKLGNKPPQNVIDIGCADGRITHRFCHDSQNIKIFEPNPFLFSLAVSHLSRGNNHLEAHNSIFLPGYRTKNSSADFIIASHLLYHIDRKNWGVFFRAVTRYLRPGGTCAIVLWNKDSEARRLSTTLVPDRWVCSAEDILEHLTDFEKLGLNLVKEFKLAPKIKVHTSEMARVVTYFLVGHSRNRTIRHKRIENIIVDQLYGDGLINSQSVIIFRKQDGYA